MPTPEQSMETMVKNLAEKTGKSLDDWVKVARSAKLAKHGEIVGHLKTRHGLGHGYANLVAMNALKTSHSPELGSDALVDDQYAGSKAALRPIYDKLIAAVKKFGGDVEISPKKTYVSLRRSKQFGLIQPSTATRVDVGINLKGQSPTARLEPSGSFNAMVSHRVRIQTSTDVDAELIEWLKQAYSKA